MDQAHLQALLTEVQILKRDLQRYMSTTELEKQNLEAHVDLCSERYKGLHDRLSAIEVRLAKMNEDMSTSDQLSPEDADRAKKLADKAVFVRKKLDDHTQYALNRKIKFVANEKKK